MFNVIQRFRNAIAHVYKNWHRERAYMNKTAKQYVTISTVVAANAKMIGRVSGAALTRDSSLGATRPLPPLPSRTEMAQAGVRALQSLKASR